MILHGGLWWTNVLNLALPPQRYSPDAWLEQQEPFIHMTREKKRKERKKRKKERKKGRKEGRRKDGKKEGKKERKKENKVIKMKNNY